MLFVGFSDNTCLESYVSLYKTFAHVNMTGPMVECMFLYHARLAPDREALCAPSMRSETGGARRECSKQQAAAGKPLRSHHHGSMKQQAELCRWAVPMLSYYSPT